jgi:hypothetical protein
MSHIYADETYARGRQDDTRAGGIILVVTSCLAGLLVLLGLIYYAGSGPRHQAGMIAAGCEPSLFITGLPCTTRQMVISHYESIVTPAGKLIDADIAAYQANEGHNLVAAEASLSAEVTTEQAVDNSLAAATFTPQNNATALALMTNAASNGNSTPMVAVIFTPQITVAVDALIKADQTLAKLTAEQARSSSLTQMRSFNHRVQVANTAVQTKLKLAHEAVEAPLPAP